MNKQIYLRETVVPRRYASETCLEIFEGDIKQDKVQWQTTHNAKVRYFKLQEVQ